MKTLLLAIILSAAAEAGTRNFRVGRIDGKEVHHSVWMEEWQARSILRIGCFVGANNPNQEWLEIEKSSWWWKGRYIKKEKFSCK